jgi:hypothetical protein
MTKARTLPLPWTGIDHINDVNSLSPDDEACLDEIRDVLGRHGRQNKFGVALLHYHFPIGDDEILVEHCDTKNRILTVRTVPQGSLDHGRLIETIWRFDGINGQLCQRRDRRRVIFGAVTLQPGLLDEFAAGGLERRQDAAVADDVNQVVVEHGRRNQGHALAIGVSRRGSLPSQFSKPPVGGDRRHAYTR